jgi:hypothetical protein
MPDQDTSEILLQEIAILPREVAEIRGALEKLDQLVGSLNVTLLRHIEQQGAIMTRRN